MKIVKITDEVYQEYLVNKPAVPLQMQLAMVELYRDNGWQCHPIGMIDGTGEIVGVAILSGKPMTLAGMHYTCQYGPYLNSYSYKYIEIFFRAIIDYLKNYNCTKFSCNPAFVKYQYDLTGEIINTNHQFDQEILFKLGYQQQDLSIDTNGKIDMRYMFKKDLNFETVEQLRASYKGSTRRNVKTAIKNLVEIENLEPNKLDVFTTLMAKSGAKHGFRIHGSEYYSKLKEMFGDRAMLLLAKVDVENFLNQMSDQVEENQQTIKAFNGNNQQGQITKLEQINNRLMKMIKLVAYSPNIIDGYIYLSAGVYIQTSDQLIHFLSGNDNTYSRFNSSVLMQDYAMRIALERHLSVFNMYGVKGTFAKDDSVFQFKTGFGGYVEEYIGTFDYQLAPLRLKTAQALKTIVNLF